jgi:poly(hydroxyalkanoate) granule-associated protein
MPSKTTAFPALAQLQDSVRSLQSGAEELLDRVRKEAGKLAGKDQRKAIEHLLSQAKSFPADFQKRATKTLKSVAGRALNALSQIRTQSSKRLDPLLSHLSIPSRHEVEQLAKRLSSLEKKVEDLMGPRHGGAR